jgi:murein DD-endopeptidase MepM/ murein hydrolase activator NlpD
VFAWDIDFVLDIREGDRFTAVYEQIYQDGKYLRDGEVLAAEFVNGGKVYRAVRFVDENGSVGYYTPDGKPMRKAFLRAPVEFTRVSSVFNPHRLHPILNLIRGHMGTDYAAPIGTPVHAAGDGRVAFEGRAAATATPSSCRTATRSQTLYGHMSRFARDIHVGSHVQQGEVIGYVGMTGLATGPHLHYEYLMNGVHKDPQTVKLPGADPLSADAMGRFHRPNGPLARRSRSAANGRFGRQAGLTAPAGSGEAAVPPVDPQALISAPFPAGESQFVGEPARIGQLIESTPPRHGSVPRPDLGHQHGCDRRRAGGLRRLAAVAHRRERRPLRARAQGAGHGPRRCPGSRVAR